jgi:hypothetical protein
MLAYPIGVRKASSGARGYRLAACFREVEFSALRSVQ